MARLLIVLDLNGTILESTHKKRTLPHDTKARYKYVYYRPGMQEFILWLMALENVDVALWTSNKRENAIALAQIAFPDPKRLKFILSREDCKVFADYSSEKHVQKIFDMGYTPNNTLFVDDSNEKVVHPKKSEFFFNIKEFQGGYPSSASDSELLVLKTVIETKLRGLMQNNKNLTA